MVFYGCSAAFFAVHIWRGLLPDAAPSERACCWMVVCVNPVSNSAVVAAPEAHMVSYPALPCMHLFMLVQLL